MSNGVPSRSHLPKASMMARFLAALLLCAVGLSTASAQAQYGTIPHGSPPVNVPIPNSNIVSVYGASDFLDGPKLWIGSTTTDASGNFTASISSASCSAAPISVQTTAVAADQTAANAVQAYVTGTTTTSISGSVVKPVQAVGGSSTAAKAPAGVTVFVFAACK